MAKRRKEKDEEEDKPFKMPKFDEEAFLKRERRNIKITFFSFLFGIIMAVVCFGFWALMGPNDLRWELVLLVGVIYALSMRYIFLRLNFDFLIIVLMKTAILNIFFIYNSPRKLIPSGME